MKSPAVTSSPSSPSVEPVIQKRGFTGLILLLMGLVILAIRYLTFEEAFERDITIYAVMAHEMLAGRPLYSDLWDIKPPGVYLFYAAAELIAGYGRSAIYLLGVSAALVTLLGVYRAVIEATSDKLAALWASFFWVLVCSDIGLQANQPNSEVFINAAFIWGLALFLRAHRVGLQQSSEVALQGKKARQWLLLGAGCIWAGATLVKQVAFVAPLLLSVALFFAPGAVSRRSRLAGVAALLGPTVVVWAATFAYFGLTDRWQIFSFSMVEFGRVYVDLSSKVAEPVSLWTRLAPPALFTLSPLVLLVWAALMASQRQLSWLWTVLGVCAVATQIAVFLPGWFLLHYYQLWLPVLCWAAGFGIAQWRRYSPRNAWTPWLAGVAAMALVLTQWPNWRLSPDEVSIRKYRSPVFVKQFEMSPRIDALLEPDQTLYQYGYDPAFYFVTKRRPPVGVLSMGSPEVTFPSWFEERIIGILKREKPELVWVDFGFSRNEITDYIQANYALLPDRDKSDRLILFARRGGTVVRRVAGWPLEKLP